MSTQYSNKKVLCKSCYKKLEKGENIDRYKGKKIYLQPDKRYLVVLPGFAKSECSCGIDKCNIEKGAKVFAIQELEFLDDMSNWEDTVLSNNADDMYYVVFSYILSSQHINVTMKEYAAVKDIEHGVNLMNAFFEEYFTPEDPIKKKAKDNKGGYKFIHSKNLQIEVVEYKFVRDYAHLVADVSFFYEVM